MPTRTKPTNVVEWLRELLTEADGGTRFGTASELAALVPDYLAAIYEDDPKKVRGAISNAFSADKPLTREGLIMRCDDGPGYMKPYGPTPAPAVADEPAPAQRTGSDLEAVPHHDPMEAVIAATKTPRKGLNGELSGFLARLDELGYDYDLNASNNAGTVTWVPRP